MRKLNFNITINAPKSKVWNVLWDDETYVKWTSVFSEGSHPVTDWQEGSQIWFLDVKKNGMYSIISKVIPEELMLFNHQGIVLDGVKQPTSPESEEWRGAKEEYRLKEEKGITELSIEMDVTDKYFDYFKETVPKGLDTVKNLSEEK